MSINKGQGELERIILLMKYDNRMTLSENVEITNEQWEQIKAGLTPYYEKAKSVVKSAIKDPKTAIKKGIGAAIKGAYDNPAALGTAFGSPSLGLTLTVAKNWNDIREYFENADSHDWLTLIELTTLGLAMIPTPASPFLFAISTAAGVADAYVYYKEGDKYMAGLMLVLSVIPGGELAKTMKGSKTFLKKGSSYVSKILKRAKSGKTLSEIEQQELKEVSENFVKESGPIKKLFNKNLRKSIAAKLASKSPKYLVNILARIKKLYGKFYLTKFSKLILQVGGSAYSFDKIYLFVNRDYALNQENLDDRTRNELRMMVNSLLGYEDEVNEYLLLTTKEAMMNMINSGVNPLEIEVTESPEEYFDTAIKNFENEINNEGQTTEEGEPAQTEQTPSVMSTSPTLDDVVSKKINPSTSKPFVIKKGQKGDSVGEVQKLLDYLSDDYGNILRRGMDETESGVDSKFGPNTFDAIKKFQEDNGLKIDGIVGSETLTKLKELTK
jgi:hypothetical protein